MISLGAKSAKSGIDRPSEVFGQTPQKFGLSKIRTRFFKRGPAVNELIWKGNSSIQCPQTRPVTATAGLPSKRPGVVDRTESKFLQSETEAASETETDRPKTPTRTFLSRCLYKAS